jgi:DNA-binding GntR family transcriptional regulator
VTSYDADGLVDRVAATIQSRILSGEIASGTRLRQESLATEFGVSRTPVREALRKLQSTGIVAVEPRRGALVRAPTARDVREAYQVRAELEGLAAEISATQIGDDDLDRLRDADAHFRHSIEDVIQGRRRGNREHRWSAESEWERANNVFHQVIQHAAGNAQLIAAIAHLHRSFPRHLTWTALSRSSHLLARNVQEHHRILTTIEERDPAAARAAMADHVRSAGELVAQLLER